jgi:hypothetical protein
MNNIIPFLSCVLRGSQMEHKGMLLIRIGDTRRGLREKEGTY